MIKKRLSIKSKYNWPLMKNNISQADKKVLIKFIRQSDDFTSEKKILSFLKYKISIKLREGLLRTRDWYKNLIILNN